MIVDIQLNRPLRSPLALHKRDVDTLTEAFDFGHRH